MSVFIWNKQGKPVAETGEHDDCVIMLAGLLQLHQRCPVADDFSWVNDKPAACGNYAIAGQVAYYDEDDDDDEDDFDLLYEG